MDKQLIGKSLAILSISPLRDDQTFLLSITDHSNWVCHIAQDLETGVSLLQKHDISVVVCESKLTSGTWKDVLNHISLLPHPPSLIVTSKFADDRLWSEVLHLNGWDVLQTPFDRTEVLRSIKSAWQHRHHDQIQMSTHESKTIRAAS